MKNKIRWVVCGIVLLLGAVLCTLGMISRIDPYWSGMGAGLLAVGILRLLRQIRYQTDGDYRQTVDVSTGDERNRYLSMKAWAWAGYAFVLIAAVASIVLRVTGQEELSLMASWSLCLVVLLYWLSWMVLRRKY